LFLLWISPFHVAIVIPLDLSFLPFLFYFRASEFLPMVSFFPFFSFSFFSNSSPGLFPLSALAPGHLLGVQFVFFSSLFRAYSLVFVHGQRSHQFPAAAAGHFSQAIVLLASPCALWSCCSFFLNPVVDPVLFPPPSM